MAGGGGCLSGGGSGAIIEGVDTDVLLRVAVVVAVLAVLWVLPDWGRYRDRVLGLGRRWHLAGPEVPLPEGPPIERIAADLRRIRGQVRRPPPGAAAARRRGWLEAYDDVLVDACHALGLEQRLHELPEGPERDFERERVERLLARAGVL